MGGPCWLDSPRLPGRSRWAGGSRRPKHRAWPGRPRGPSPWERLMTGRSTVGGFPPGGQGQTSRIRPDRGDGPVDLRGANQAAAPRARGRPGAAASQRGDTSSPICGGAHARDGTPHAQENNCAIWSGHALPPIETGERAPTAAYNDYRASRPSESTLSRDMVVPKSVALQWEYLSGGGGLTASLPVGLRALQRLCEKALLLYRIEVARNQPRIIRMIDTSSLN